MQCVGHPPMPYPSHDSFLRPSFEHSFDLPAILPSTFIRLLFPPILPSYDLPAILDSTFLRSFLRASFDPSFDPSFFLRCQASRPNRLCFLNCLLVQFCSCLMPPVVLPPRILLTTHATTDAAPTLVTTHATTSFDPSFDSSFLSPSFDLPLTLPCFDLPPICPSLDLPSTLPSILPSAFLRPFFQWF